MPARTQMLGDHGNSVWLEYFSAESEEPQRAVIEDAPFKIGRNPDMNLQIDSHRVSRAHAEVVRRDEGWAIRDLGSTNGTFLNGRRVEGSQEIEDGDLILIADVELTFCRSAPLTPRRTATLAMDSVVGSERITTTADEVIGHIRRLHELLTHAALPLEWQPVVEVGRSAPLGWRVELRIAQVEDRWLQRLLALPGRLPQMGRDLFRQRAVAEFPAAESAKVFLLPVWSEDLGDEELPAKFGHWARSLPARVQLVAEAGVAELEPETLHPFAESLRAEGVELALAGFVGGKAQLEPWCRSAPKFLLLDERVTRDLALAGGRSRQLAALAATCRSWNGRVIAGGIRDDETAEACREAGCEWTLGSHGTPVLAAEARPLAESAV